MGRSVRLSLLLYFASSTPDTQVSQLPCEAAAVLAQHAYELDHLLDVEEEEELLRRKRQRYEPCPIHSRNHVSVQPCPIHAKKSASAKPCPVHSQKRPQNTRPNPRLDPKANASIYARLYFRLCSLSRRRRYQLLIRFRYHKQKKPYSAISVHVERLTSETFDEDDLAGVPDLTEVVRLQSTGPQEVARSLRKKLKYGNVHQQLRSLTILDGLVQNGGERLQRSIFNDEPLLERLRIAATDPVSDPDVRAKCKVLFGQWAANAKNSPALDGAPALYRQLPKKIRAPVERREQSKVLRETEEDARREEEMEKRRASVTPARPAGPSTPPHSTQHVNLSSGPTFSALKSSKKDKKSKNKTFNLEREKPVMLQTIAGSQVASTNLTNALKLVNREDKRVSQDPEVMKRFETCKQLRRQILRYIQYVESDDYLGGLIHANEELVSALMAFEVLDKSVDDDSDSAAEEAQRLSRKGFRDDKKATEAPVGLSISPPNRPLRPGNIAMPTPTRSFGKSKKVESSSSESTEESDENNPFGDRNATATPGPEKKASSWKEV